MPSRCCTTEGQPSPSVDSWVGLPRWWAFVLTAAHNVGDGQHRIRIHGGKEFSARLRCRGRPDELSDLALLEIDDSTFENDPSTLSFADIDRTVSETIEGCWAVGFPPFKERKFDGDKRPKLRDTVQLNGRRAGNQSRERPTGPRGEQNPRALPTGAPLKSTWQGISGAVVFARYPDHGSLAIGVVTEHVLPEGKSSLTVAPISAVAGLTDASRWWKLLGLASVGELVRLPVVPVIQPSPYWATIDEIVRYTPVLLEREQEITDLKQFSTGVQGYRWIIGPPWSGKTALAAHFTRSVPAEVDVVAFLSSAVEARPMVALHRRRQRPARSPPRGDPPSPTDDVQALRDLWRRAVEHARESERHLLLVVDGLDEDIGSTAGLPSVAALLPTLIGDHRARPRHESALPRVARRRRHRSSVTAGATGAARGDDGGQGSTAAGRSRTQGRAPTGWRRRPDVAPLARRILCLLAAARGGSRPPTWRPSLTTMSSTSRTSSLTASPASCNPSGQLRRDGSCLPTTRSSSGASSSSPSTG